MSRLLACVVGLSLVPAANADWNQFRGPTGAGHADSKNLPVEFGPSKNVAWKTAIPGGGWSSPVVVGGKVYVTTAVPAGDKPEAGQSLRTLCLDAANGSILWNEEVFKPVADGPRIHKKNSHASPTPIVANGKVYVHFGHMGTACLDAGTGAKVWADRMKYLPVHGNGGTLVLHDGRLFYSIDGTDVQKVVARDAATGKVAWETPRKAGASKPFSFTTPTVITVNGKDQIISAGSDVVMALEPTTGKEIWRAKYPGGFSLIPKPVFAHGLVFVCTGYSTPTLMAIKPDGTGDVTATKVAWSTKTNVPHSASVLVVGGDLYMVADKGVLSCLDAKTGAVKWSERVGGNYSASPTFAGGRIYLFSEEGEATVFEPGPAYEPSQVNKLDERTLASPAVDGDALFVRTAGNLYRFEKK